MSLKATLNSIKFNNQFYNGNSFSENPDTDFNFSLAGNVMELNKVRINVSISSYTEADLDNILNLSSNGVSTIITRQQNTWNSDGFAIGDQITVERGINTLLLTILGISDTEIVLNTDISGIIPDGDYSDILVYNRTLTGAVIYNFGLINNQDTLSFENLTTGDEQGFYVSEVNSTFKEMSPLGEISGWVTGSARAKTSGSSFLPNGAITYNYDIEHEFRIIPYWRDGDINNLNSLIPIDVFEGINSLKYVFKADFRKSLSDQPDIKTISSDSLEGSVGWFNETLNGFQNNYKILSVQYREPFTFNYFDTVKITEPTQVILKIKKLDGNFKADNKTFAYFSYLPDEDQYTEQFNDYDSVFIFDSANHTAGVPGPSTGQNYIIDCFSFVSGNEVELEFTVDFDNDTKDFLLQQENLNFIVGVGVGDRDIAIGNTDRVTLIGDVNQFDNTVNLEGIINVESFEIFSPEQDFVFDTGTTSYIGWNEDGLINEISFSVDRLRNGFLNSIEFKVIAFNTVTEYYFELDSAQFSVNQANIVGGNQILNIESERGYNLSESDARNVFTLNTDNTNPNLPIYTIKAGQKIPWQEWQSIIADEVFFDENAPQNGLNRKSSNYSNINDYSIRIAVSINLSGEDLEGRSGSDDVLIITPDLPIYDYDEPAEWSGLIQTFEPDTLSDLEGNVLSNKNTLFRITWTKIGTTISDITSFWAFSRIEIAGQQGFDIYELSNIAETYNSNPLKPLANETGLKLYLDSGNVVTECLIDPNFIDVSQGVNLSGRISGEVIELGGKTTEAGDSKTTESGTLKTIESA